MADQTTAPEPSELTEEIFAALEDKAALPLGSMIVLGILAGAYVGLGGLFATVALAGADALPFGTAQVIAGFVFATGLALVLIAGAELFTGNTLMAGPLAAGRIKPSGAARSLFVVYLANFAGALMLAAAVLAADVHEAGEGAVGRVALDLGMTKIDKGLVATFASGILANMLVCLAIWLAYAGRTVTQKMAGLILPIAAFVAAGLEHSVANMYLLPYALMVQTATGETASISVIAIIANLVPATIGNIIGGSLVGLAYWRVYGRG
jgi:formate transporter